ncbi:MAG: hypothetical protein AAGA48_28585 [Myxococcota bacterium]
MAGDRSSAVTSAANPVPYYPAMTGEEEAVARDAALELRMARPSSETRETVLRFVRGSAKGKFTREIWCLLGGTPQLVLEHLVSMEEEGELIATRWPRGYRWTVKAGKLKTPRFSSHFPTTRDAVRPIIRRVLEKTAGQPEASIRAALRQAYPFGARRWNPYKVWLDEIQVQRGLKPPPYRRREQRAALAEREALEDAGQALLFGGKS